MLLFTDHRFIDVVVVVVSGERVRCATLPYKCALYQADCELPRWRIREIPSDLRLQQVVNAVIRIELDLESP